MRIRVIGVGGPRGGDRVGWRVVEALRPRRLPGGPEIVARDRPGLSLLEDLVGLDAAVLVDAMRGGLPPGSVRILGREDLAGSRGLSTHDVGVGATLALAEALGHRLPAIRLVGIEVPELRGDASSPELAGAVEEACAAVGRALAELGGGILDGGRRIPPGASRTLPSRTGELL